MLPVGLYVCLSVFYFKLMFCSGCLVCPLTRLNTVLHNKAPSINKVRSEFQCEEPVNESPLLSQKTGTIKSSADVKRLPLEVSMRPASEASPQVRRLSGLGPRGTT